MLAILGYKLLKPIKKCWDEKAYKTNFEEISISKGDSLFQICPGDSWKQF